MVRVRPVVILELYEPSCVVRVIDLLAYCCKPVERFDRVAVAVGFNAYAYMQQGGGGNVYRKEGRNEGRKEGRKEGRGGVVWCWLTCGKIPRCLCVRTNI